MEWISGWALPNLCPVNYFNKYIHDIGFKKMDLQPDKVAYLLKQLLDLSESVPLPQISEFLEQQRGRKRKLEQEIENLELNILDAKSRLDMVLNEEATTRDELNQFSSLKAVLLKKESRCLIIQGSWGPSLERDNLALIPG
jgi:hypothetical protein